MTTLEIPHGLHRGRNFLEYIGDCSDDPILLLMEIPHMLHLEGKIFKSCGCMLLVCRNNIGSRDFTIYEMMKGCFVWTVRYIVNTDEFMTPLPERWSIRSIIFDIGSNQMGDDDDVEFIPPFSVDPNISEFIPSLASEKGNQVMDKAGQEAQSCQYSAQQECLNEEFVRVGPKPKFAPVAGYHRFDADGPSYLAVFYALCVRAHTTLANVSSLLRAGGIFIGTIPNANVIAICAYSDRLALGNSVYRIQFHDEFPEEDRADGLALGNSVYRIQFDDEFPEEEVNCRQVHSEDEKDFGQCLQKAIGVEHLTGLASPYF
ncbi:lysophospholipid acyltransferase 1-like protein [Tanacetum coccineum]